MATFSSRRFNQDSSGAKRAAAAGPVYITDRGETSHVLITISEFRRLKELAGEKVGSADSPSILDMLASDCDDADEFDKVLEQIREESRAEAPRAVELD